MATGKIYVTQGKLRENTEFHFDYNVATLARFEGQRCIFQGLLAFSKKCFKHISIHFRTTQIMELKITINLDIFGVTFTVVKMFIGCNVIIIIVSQWR